MTRNEVIRLAKRLGWKTWGKLRQYSGSRYQCFRRGNHYAWIGMAFVERDIHGVAEDFRYSSNQAIRKFLI